MKSSFATYVSLAVLFFGAALSPANASGAATICRIQVVEKGTGWPVPLVELRTTHQERFVTDNAGVIAFDLPELMGRKTWFDVIGQGYEVPKDGLGMSGVQLTPEPGKTLRVEVTRTIIARRLGRLTGGGLFAESQKLGDETVSGWKESGVLGCDSVQNAVYRGKLFWLWGDTALPNYPLGIFDCSCATTSPHPLTQSQFQPPLKVSFDYFTDGNGNPRGVAKIPGRGPTWLAGMVTVPDANGQPHLVAAYMKIDGPVHACEWGLCQWNATTKKFEPMRVLWKESAASPRPPPVPDGHAIIWTDNNGKQWLLFGNPLPYLRCPATFEDWQNTNTWETLTPQKNLTSAADGSPVKPHAGSIAWNPWRHRWVTVFEQVYGKPSFLGEIWYAEAETDSPLGPWGKAVKILSHDNYTFYNPTIHPEFTVSESNSPVLFFEGTYSRTFAANNPPPTPRYDYNQILYRLDLDDPRLRPAETP